MSQYASLTVAQLKDALKEKNLPTEGKKAELIARLDEASSASSATAATAEVDEKPAPVTASATEEQPQTQENGESAPTETGNGESVDTTTAETNNISGAEAVEEKKPEKKVLSPEERKQLAVELLTKKIQRAEKFGDEASATAAKKDLARVEKFGVDPSTALGKEISALGKDVNSELATRKFANKKNKKRGANKGKKVSKK